MQFKVFTTLALAVAAVAVPTPSDSTEQCTTTVQCCNSVQAASAVPGIGLLTGLLGLVLPGLDTIVGLTCNPLSIIGGGNSCNGQTVCCQNNHFSGLISIGCSPINLDIL